ncbi:MAG: hypothetical protein WA888_02670 [Burkholderiaceae bacterium]
MVSEKFLRWIILAVSSSVVAACGGADGGTGGDGDDPGTANVELRSLTYTNTGNWQYKMLLQTAQDATADANGNFARYELYVSNTNGSLNTWASSPNPAQANDLYWNGFEWRTCAQGYRTTLGPVTAGSDRQFNYCDMYAVGSEVVIESDISGRLMTNVMAEIRAQPGDDGFINFADYGPNNSSDLGSTTFPDGSTKRDVVSSVDSFAVRYADNNTSNIRAYNADLASGGTPASNSACSPAISSTIDDLSSEAVSLEDLTAVALGTPCSYAQATNSLGEMSVSPHEWWGPSTIEFGELQGVDVRPIGTANYYLPEPSMRIAFDGGNFVSFFECLQRRSDGSIRNCTYLGDGNFAIETLGDARVMTFTGMPARFDTLAVDRVLVERGGRVAPGYREKSGAHNEVGFNDVATRALFARLLMPVPVPQ